MLSMRPIYFRFFLDKKVKIKYKLIIFRRHIHRLKSTDNAFEFVERASQMTAELPVLKGHSRLCSSPQNIG